MTVYIFTGPTLHAAAGRKELDAVFLPPASQGDVYRVAARHPAAIGIVDGRFQDVPAVWHKEILWALSQGIPVYGSASMGALRAAELAAFGMRGVGWIFEAYRDGLLEDDDEVAVAHAGVEDDFLPTSDAMINIRRTLAAAQADGIIDVQTTTRLTTAIKEVFYPLCSYRLVRPLGRKVGLPSADIDKLEAWLRQNRIDQKRTDAVEMLHRILDDLHTAAPPAVTFTFQHTQYFERMRRSAGELVHDASGGDLMDVTLEDLLNELRLDPDAYATVRERALVRCLAVREHARIADHGSDEDLRDAADRFRRSRGLHDPAATRRWLADNHLATGQFAALIREERAVGQVHEATAETLDIYLRSQLRVEDRYPGLIEQVRRKRRFLADRGLDDVATAHRTSRVDLLHWYFTARGMDVPADVAAYARALGFADQITFLRAVQRDYWFRTHEVVSDHPTEGSST
jgi:hypothetical protein